MKAKPNPGMSVKTREGPLTGGSPVTIDGGGDGDGDGDVVRNI